tara:strand:+ start:449 stop:550 length:102 start_codon:yes stop_codon:yes gene_type:complete
MTVQFVAIYRIEREIRGRRIAAIIGLEEAGLED